MKKYIWSNKCWFVFAFFSIALIALVDTLKAYLLQYIIDSIPDLNEERFIRLLLIVFSFLLAFIITFLFEVFCISKFIKKSILSLKKDLFSQVMNKKIDDFSKKNYSDYLSNFTNDINIIELDYFDSLTKIIEYSLSFVFAFIAILSINYYFIIFIAITGWLPILVNLLMANKMTNKKLAFSEASSNLVSRLKDMFGGFEIIRIHNIFPHINEIFNKVNNTAEESRYSSKLTNETCEGLSIGCSLFIWFGSLLLGSYLVMKKILSVGYVLGVNQLLNNITNPLYRISILLNKMNAAENLYKKISLSLESEQNFEVKEMKSFDNKIEFRNVSLELKEKSILNNINITFEKNKKYVIIGESGSGKSTIIKMLMKYFEEYSGQIYVDGCDLKGYSDESWYNIVSMIPQEIFLFNDTIKNNITLYETYDEDDFNNIIDKCMLKKAINSLTNMEESIINEGGKNFSGGERQRISIARALIRNTSLLLVDEATSALDIQTSYEIEKILVGCENNTVIVVTHKITEMVKQFDRIIVIDNGEIAEQGSYKELIDKKGAFFSICENSKLE